MGEILMRGNVVMKGYYKNKEATESSMRNGWFHSGDLAVVYPDGYIQIKDRSKDIIISGGENISSVEVDAKKTNLPDDIVTGDNGSTPKDIPDISSDDTTARQLRAVAEEEEDPVLKEIYWDAYREYKGIKSKN